MMDKEKVASLAELEYQHLKRIYIVGLLVLLAAGAFFYLLLKGNETTKILEYTLKG